MAYVALALCLSGCASAPLVKYNLVAAGDKEGKSRFQLNDTAISFNFAKSSSGAIDSTKYVISSGAVPYSATTYSVEGTRAWDNWGTSTDIQATYLDGSPLTLSSAGSSITNQIPQTLQTIGSVAAGIAAFAAARPGGGAPGGGSNGVTLPTGILISTFIADAAAQKYAGCTSDATGDGEIKCNNLELEGGQIGGSAFKIDISIEPTPKDALSVSSLKFPFLSNSLIYAACRSATVVLHVPAYTIPAAPSFGGASTKPIDVPASQVVQNLVVADARWIETMAFPPKGKITLASSCGANATADSYTPVTALDIANDAVQAASTAAAKIKVGASHGGSGVKTKS